jgi:hypothetical protein
MRSRVTRRWALVSAALFPLTSLVPFFLLKGFAARLLHLFIPLWMVAIRAYWSNRKKREAVKLVKGRAPATHLKRYDFLVQVSLIFLFFFEYVLLLCVTVYPLIKSDHGGLLLAAVFLFGCAVFYVPHVVLRVKAHGHLERYVAFNARDKSELSGMISVNRVNLSRSVR